MKKETGVKKPPKSKHAACPRCGNKRLWKGKDKALNALSRRDNKTYVCSPCGQEEALIDLLGVPSTATEKWKGAGNG
jgi:DNA-directed RNA polymerase subunit RPC12/RpoP